MKIPVSFFFLFICICSFAQQVKNTPAHKKNLPAANPVSKTVDSLKNLLSGYNLAIQSNPANSIYKRKKIESLTGITSRTNAACSFFCTGAPLPVTGLELEGERINETNVNLSWKTYTEINNLGFYVERTFDPASAYISRSFVAGAGNSYSTLDYRANDLNDYEGITYYRLRQVDIDGQFKYSNVVPVNGYTIKPGIVVLPNPGTNNQTVFRVTGFKANEIIDISITDATGRIVAKKKMTALQNRYSIPLSTVGKLSSGYYYITVQSKEKKADASFVIID
jgi:Secretion system C-terminal sorting domain